MGRKEKPLAKHPDGTLTLGARLRVARGDRQLTLDAVAERVGYTKAHLSSVENDRARPSRELVAAYERALELSAGTLLAIFDLEIAPPPVVQPEKRSRPRATAGDSLDGELDHLAAELALSESEHELVRRIMLAEARTKARGVRSSADWWLEPGPISICCVPMAGWQWREWTREQIVTALDRAAAEAMSAHIRELVLVLPPAEIAAMEETIRRPTFAHRLQTITCVAQPAPRGLGDAILRTRSIIDDRPFAVLLPDNQFDRYGSDATVLGQLVDLFATHDANVIAAADLQRGRRHYGLARLRAAGAHQHLRPVTLLAEKPGRAHPIFAPTLVGEASATHAVVGRYVLSPTVLTALAEIQGERLAGAPLELTDALQRLIDRDPEAVAAFVLPSVIQLDRDETVFVATYPARGSSRSAIA